jgi:hypothetical protein
MSELIHTRNGKNDFHWQLLTTVSAVALLAAVYGSREARAGDQNVDQPTVWIELGGQLVHASGQGDSFPIGFLAANPNSPVLRPVSPLQAQRPEPFGFAEEGKITFQPESSGWNFSVGVTYGRSNSSKHIHNQTDNVFYKYLQSGLPRQPAHPDTKADFADTHAQRRESHVILDFTAGKDVGMGMFGKESSSTVGLGVRFAQLASKASFDVRARPDLEKKYARYPAYHVTYVLPHFHTYHATGQASRSFSGIGPSLSWKASAAFAGNPSHGEAMLDWGVNAAILFGKQKARVRHQESGHYYATAVHALNSYALTYQRSGGHTNDRSVMVPNVGGFAGASYRIENFKVSAGYRADFFFGAIDGGIDARKSETLGFYGPFASVSVGLGG